ncbi:MAG TPA: LytTR family DNA-binding domain-containing protein [Clostridia bacterium]|nr:LytTR family DNA-binding domain-containing protein [Clostridia bacterium]
MKYRFAICDDIDIDARYLSNIVAKWAAAVGAATAIEIFPSAEAFLYAYAEDKLWHVLLLDIEMGRMNGVELAKTVRVQNKEIQIVFVTGYSDYIFDGYDVEALHYLMKPIDEGKLFAVLDRAAQRLERSGRALFIDARGETVRIPLYEIKYLEVRQNYVTIHAKREHVVKKTLNELEKELDDSFFRTGRSHIVNLACIRKVTKAEVQLMDGTALPLPRGMYEPLNRALIRHF